MPANTTWHEWPTNFSNGTGITGIGSWIRYSNLVVGGYLGPAILVLIWIIVFFGGMLVGVKRAGASASFIAFVFSVYFWRIDMINPVIIVALIVITILIAIGSKTDGGY